jgi:hypothetical protein
MRNDKISRTWAEVKKVSERDSRNGEGRGATVGVAAFWS